jgi:hypothetical protein
VVDPDTGTWLSDAEVAETSYTAFDSSRHRVTARLIVRRVKDARYPDALFPVWRYHPFFTNSTEPAPQADITHRQHAIIETVFADLIDGPLAHMPSGRFGANSAWVLCAAIAHNLLRATGVIAGKRHAVARGATLRRTVITVPGWPALNASPSCICPVTGRGPTHGFDSGTTSSAIPNPQQPEPAARPDPNPKGKAGQTSGSHAPTDPRNDINTSLESPHDPHQWIQA